MNILTKLEETHRLRKWTYGHWGYGIVRDFGKIMYKLLYLKRIANKDLLYSTWNSTQCYVPAWRGRVVGREWMHVYVWPSLFTLHLKLPQHCKSAIPQYKKFKVWGRKIKVYVTKNWERYLPCNALQYSSIPGQGTKIPHATKKWKLACCSYLSLRPLEPMIHS